MGGEPLTEFIRWIIEEHSGDIISLEDAQSYLDDYNNLNETV